MNLWREWARLEVGNLRGEGYALPDAFEAYAGSVVCVAQDAGPDAGGFEAPEIVTCFKEAAPGGADCALPSRPARVAELVDEYGAGFSRRLLDALPPESLAQG